MKFDEVKLSDLCTDGRGYYGIGASAVPYDNNKYTYLRITDINDDGTLNYNSFMSVDDKDAKNYILSLNDIVFARTGASTGRNYLYDGEIKNMVYAGFLIKFSLDAKKVNPFYIKYYCLSQQYKSWIESIKTGSTRGNINEKQLSNMPIMLPSRIYQDKVAEILKKIDKKTKLNNQINNNLHEYMKKTFDNWILNLGNYSKSSLSEIATYTNGLAMQKFRPEQGIGLPVVKIKEMNSGLSNETERCTENIKEEVKINNGDVLFAWSGTLCMTIWCSGLAGLNQHIFKVTSNKYPKWFYYFWTMHHLEKFKMIAEGKTTTMGHIKRNELDLAEVLVPTVDELKNMNKLMKPLLEKYINNNVQNKALEQLRDTLLPKLMNGEIDLDNIEI